MFSYQGAIVALVTPMEENGDISWESLFTLIDRQIEGGIDGIVVVGTTGESATIDVSEHIQIIERSVKYADKRVPIIAGTGANSTKEAVFLTTAAKEAGADAVLLVTPYYNKPTQEGLFQHYSTIANEVNINQILYNVPGRTACDLKPSTVAKLASHDNIIGLKEAIPDISRLKQLLEQVSDVQTGNFLLFSGDDLTSSEFMMKGGHGTISVTANIVPELISALTKASLKQNNKVEAQRIHELLLPLNNSLFVESNPIPVKWAMSRLGVIPSGIRLPLTQLDNKFVTLLEASLEDLQLLNYI